MATINSDVSPVLKETKPASKENDSIIDQGLRLLSSVRFGIIMLLLLLGCSILGMVIMQQNVEGFREYYARLSPAQRNMYETLSLFDIYHSWYFTLLLAITGLNIILSSVDRFPAAWAYIKRPKLAASPKFINAQMFNETVEIRQEPDALARQIAANWRKAGMRSRIDRQGDTVTVFGQRNVWNRLGAYVVHVALLMIFIGGFLTSRYGVGGQMEIIPGESSSAFTSFDNQLQGQQMKKARLPFEIECADLKQELIRPEGGLDVMNTIDWLSYIRIKDNGAERPALVHLNSPYDYRGYRFFQSSFLPQGFARQISLSFAPGAGGPSREVTIERNGSVDLEGIGRVSYTSFYPDFVNEGGKPETASGDYNNPVAEISVTTPEGKTETAYAFTDQSPNASLSGKPDQSIIAGSHVTLKSFEKVALSHTLTIQYDPGRTPVYAGFVLLVIALCGVFFFSHQRVWAVIEPAGKRSKVHIGGNTNRNKPSFEGRFNSLAQLATGGTNNE